MSDRTTEQERTRIAVIEALSRAMARAAMSPHLMGDVSSYVLTDAVALLRASAKLDVQQLDVTLNDRCKLKLDRRHLDHFATLPHDNPAFTIGRAHEGSRGIYDVRDMMIVAGIMPRAGDRYRITFTKLHDDPPNHGEKP